MKIWVVKLQTVLEFSQTRNRGRCSPILTEPFICFQRSWNHKLEIIWATLKKTQDSLPPMKWNKSSGQKISSIALENTKNKISKKREGWERRGGGSPANSTTHPGWWNKHYHLDRMVCCSLYHRILFLGVSLSEFTCFPKLGIFHV